MDKIHEIRVEEVHDHEEGKHFYRVYMEVNETIKIIGESQTKPELVRYLSFTSCCFFSLAILRKNAYQEIWVK